MKTKVLRFNERELNEISQSISQKRQHSINQIKELKNCKSRPNDYTEEELIIIEERLEYNTLRLEFLENLLWKLEGKK